MSKTKEDIDLFSLILNVLVKILSITQLKMNKLEINVHIQPKC